MKKSGLYNLIEIFSNGERSFRVPDYQRGYSWEEAHRKDLLNDIDYITSQNINHYTGTIVAIKSEQTENDLYSNCFDIIDGQQRLTSLILLISIILRKLDQSNVSQDEVLSNTIGKLLFKSSNGSTKRMIKLGKDQDIIFWDLIKSGNIINSEERIKTKSDRNLIDAYHEFNNWIDSKSSDELLIILNKIVNNLGFLIYIPQYNKESGIMFEVINNRGKRLSDLEKIKNYLIYFAVKNEKPDLHQTVNDRWIEILSNLNKCDITNNEDENSFLRFCWITFKQTDKAKSYHVYDQMKELFNITETNNWMELNQFVEFLFRSSEVFLKLYTRINVKNDDEKLWLERINYSPSYASIIPLILAVYDKVTDESYRIKILELLEILNFRFYVCGIANRSDTKQGTLFSWAYKFFHNYNKIEDSENGFKIDEKWLINELETFIINNADLVNVIKNLTLDKNEKGDYYHWQGLKYFLANYEQFLKNKEDEKCFLSNLLSPRDSKYRGDFLHREHIWAKECHRDEIEGKIKNDVNKRRLGNFILLKEKLNHEFSNKPIEEKIELYPQKIQKSNQTLMCRDLIDFYEDGKLKANSETIENGTIRWSRWTYLKQLFIYQCFLDRNEERYINFAIKRWKIDIDKDLIVELNSNTENNIIYKVDEINGKQ